MSDLNKNTFDKHIINVRLIFKHCSVYKSAFFSATTAELKLCGKRLPTDLPFTYNRCSIYNFMCIYTLNHRICLYISSKNFHQFHLSRLDKHRSLTIQVSCFQPEFSLKTQALSYFTCCKITTCVTSNICIILQYK